MTIPKIFTYLLDLFFPNNCICCSQPLVDGESYLCLRCLYELPRTNLHLITDNEVEQRFWGKIPVEKATSFFYYSKNSPFKRILYQIKYHGYKEAGYVLGKYAAADLKKSHFFEGIDLIIPVPLHKKKQHKRGYNQSEWIAKGLSEISGIPYDCSSVSRIVNNPTQTQKATFERHLNTDGIFRLNPSHHLENKHILLVDDVLTTGATIEACARAIQEAANTRISVFTLAVVH